MSNNSFPSSIETTSLRHFGLNTNLCQSIEGKSKRQERVWWGVLAVVLWDEIQKRMMDYFLYCRRAIESIRRGYG